MDFSRSLAVVEAVMKNREWAQTFVNELRSLYNSDIDFHSRLIHFISFVGSNGAENVKRNNGPEFWARSEIELDSMFHARYKDAMSTPEFQSIDVATILNVDQLDGLEPCIYCGCKLVNKVLDQDRGGDEGMTVKYQCTNPTCLKRWKV
jgi:DNA-directed RNA polymerase subunit M/transcription elongation factor TFIIS